MTKLRDSLVLSIVTLALASSLYFVQRAVGLTSPWFVLLAMLSFLGISAFARPLFLLRLPQSLRSVHAWELRGRIYKALGVPAYGALLRRTPLRYLNLEVYLKRGSGEATVVQDQIDNAEAAHFWAAAMLLPYMLYACAQRWWGVVAWFMAVQIGGNLYPILHLRWVRARLSRLLQRKRPSHARHA